MAYVNYPCSTPARIVAIANRTEVIPAGFRLPAVTEDSEDPAKLREEMDYAMKFCRGVGVDGGLEVLAYVQEMTHIAKLADGSYAYRWNATPSVFPLEMLSLERPAGHHTDLPTPQVLKDEFPVSEKVVLLGKEAYGASGVVSAYDSDMQCSQGAVTVSQVCTATIPPRVFFTMHAERFREVREFARDVHAPFRVIKSAMGSIKVRYSQEGAIRVFQLGLNLFDFNENLHVEGWARWSQEANDYVYSMEAINAVILYRKHCGKLWNRLEQLAGTRHYTADLLFPDEKNPLEELMKASLFVSSLPCAKLPWTPGGSVRAPQPQIQDCCNRLRSLHRRFTNPQTLNPALLIKSLPPYIRPDFDPPELAVGDPVVNLCDQDTQYVPLGALGVVVGVYSNGFAEVAFERSSAADTGRTRVVSAHSVVSLKTVKFTALRQEAAAGDQVPRKSAAKSERKNVARRYLVSPAASIPLPTDLPNPPDPGELTGPETFALSPFASEFVPKSPEGFSFSAPFS